MMKNKFTSLFRNLGFLIVGILLLFFAFRGQNFSELLQGFSEVNYLWIIVARLLAIPANVIRVERWNMLIEPLESRKPSLANSFYALMIGYLTNLATPKAGEVLRCWSVNKTDNIKTSSLFGTVIVERSIDMLILFIIVASVFLFNIDLLYSFFVTNVYAPLSKQTSTIIGEWSGTIVFLAIAFVLIVSCLYFFRHYLRSLAIVQKIQHLFYQVTKGIVTIARLNSNWRFVLLTVIMWVNYILVLYVNFWAFDITIDKGLGDVFFVYMFTVIGWAIPVQGGLGAYHWAVSQGLVLLGETFQDGLIFATVLHASNILFKLALGSVSLLIVFIKVGKKIKPGEIRQIATESSTSNDND